jgi:hypothetical protein
MSDWIIQGDEAWTSEEWEAEQERKRRHAAAQRRYLSKPEVREHRRAYQREWYWRNVEKARAYAREWQRRRKAA